MTISKFISKLILNYKIWYLKTFHNDDLDTQSELENLEDLKYKKEIK